MRDPKRIDEVIRKIKQIWKTRPELRLMQLIGNMYKTGTDLYYLEDYELVKVLSQFYKVEIKERKVEHDLNEEEELNKLIDEEEVNENED